MEDTYDSGVTNQNVIASREFLVQTMGGFVCGLKHGEFDAQNASVASWLEQHHQQHQDLFDQQAYFSGYTEQVLAADASESSESCGVGSGSQLVAQKGYMSCYAQTSPATPECNTAEGSKSDIIWVHDFEETKEAEALREAVNDLIVKERHRFKCLQCGKDYRNRPTAQDHIYVEHFQDRVRLRFACTSPGCSLKFKERRSAILHQRVKVRQDKKESARRLCNSSRASRKSPESLKKNVRGDD